MVVRARLPSRLAILAALIGCLTSTRTLAQEREVDPGDDSTTPRPGAPPGARAEGLIENLTADGIAGFRLGQTPDEVRARCRELRGRVDASDLEAGGILNCNLRRAVVASVERVAVPVAGITVGFRAGRACALTLAVDADRDPHAAAEVADRVGDAFTDSFGAPSRHAQRPEGNLVMGSTEWRPTTGVEISVRAALGELRGRQLARVMIGFAIDRPRPDGSQQASSGDDDGLAAVDETMALLDHTLAEEEPRWNGVLGEFAVAGASDAQFARTCAALSERVHRDGNMTVCWGETFRAIMEVTGATVTGFSVTSSFDALDEAAHVWREVTTSYEGALGRPEVRGGGVAGWVVRGPDGRRWRLTMSFHPRAPEMRGRGFVTLLAAGL